MQNWLLYALLSMVFAGVTSILAKHGLQNVHADVGLAVRTTVIFALIAMLNLVDAKYRQISTLTSGQMIALVLSGITTTVSWVFYYRAMKEGLVSYVAAIDKGSIVITLILSFLIFREPVTAKILIGGGLVLAGVLVLAWK